VMDIPVKREINMFRYTLILLCCDEIGHFCEDYVISPLPPLRQDVRSCFPDCVSFSAEIGCCSLSQLCFESIMAGIRPRIGKLSAAVP